MHKRLLYFGIFSLISITLLTAFQSMKDGNETTALLSQMASAPVAQTRLDTVSAEGRIEPLFFNELSFQTGGFVSEILVEEGDRVTAGDPLIRLEAADFEINLHQAQARLTSAQVGLTAAQNQLALAQAGLTTAESNVAGAEANLALAISGPLPAEIAEAESNLAAAEAAVVQAAGSRNASLNSITDSQIQAAQARLASATADLLALEDNYQAIIDACFTTPDGDEVCPLYGPVEENTRAQLEVARANQQAAQAALTSLQSGPTAAQRQLANGGVAVAQANLALAQAQLDLLLAGPTPEQIAIAEVGVQQAQVGVTLAQATIAQAEAGVKQAEAAVKTAEIAVQAAEATLARMTMNAPFDGEISRLNSRVGELVAGAVPVITLADFSEWHVKTIDLTELDVAAVEPGDSVEVTIDAIPDAAVSGEVVDVALVSSLSRGDVVYEVTIRLDEAPSLPLRWGMTVFTNIDIQ